MSQKSITSFFSRVPANDKSPGNTRNGNDKKLLQVAEKHTDEAPKEVKTSLSLDTKKRKSSLNNSQGSDDGIKTQQKKRKKIIVQSDSSEDEICSNENREKNSPEKKEIKIEEVKEKEETDNVENGSPKVTKTNTVKEEGKKSLKIKKDVKQSPKVKKDLKKSPKIKEEVKKLTKVKEELKESEKLKKSEVKPEDDKEDSSTKESTEKKSLQNFFTINRKVEPKASQEYNPAIQNYHPIDDASWKLGEKVPYYALSRTLEEIEAVSARLKIIEILSNFFRSIIVLTPEDLLPSLYLCLNQLAPAYEGIELGIAETSLMKAIAHSTGRTMAQIKVDVQNAGDLGIVAEQSKSKQRMIFQPAPLVLRTVFEKLKEIAKMTGNSSQGKKVEKIQAMFVACKDAEARFLIRSLAGKLRIGLAEQSVLQALALACTKTPPNQTYPHKILNAAKGISAESFKEDVDEIALIVKTTYCECPNYDKIIPVILREGVEKLPQHCKLTPGVPLKPMLAHPTKGVHEVLHRFDGLKFTCEWKYDGERAQIHIDENDTVSIYSRNQENNTSKYPDIIGRLPNCRTDNVKSCILDCEAVAWDREKKQILPFQILSTRKRKDAAEEDIKVQVCVFIFDLLYFNGEPLVRKPFIERRNLLKDNFKEVEGEWCFATSMDTKTMEEVQEFLEESVKGNCEGLMVKTLEEDATYEIAKRSRNWLKLKKDYLEGVGDTLDVVVIGGYLGRGKRTGTYGGFLLACYDPDEEEYQSICKIGTGFTDASLLEHTEFLKAHVIPAAKSYYRYDGGHEPDHWFDAVQIWEIKCADLSLSPVHQAARGLVDKEKGVSLRFPRFIRIRDDKKVEEATSAQQIADMYSNQDQIKNQAGNGAGKSLEEDFY